MLSPTSLTEPQVPSENPRKINVTFRSTLQWGLRSWCMLGTSQSQSGTFPQMHELIAQNRRAPCEPAAHCFQHNDIARLDLPLPNGRSEEHTSELKNIMRTSYAVVCFKNQQHHNSYLEHPLLQL